MKTTFFGGLKKDACTVFQVTSFRFDTNEGAKIFKLTLGIFDKRFQPQIKHLCRWQLVFEFYNTGAKCKKNVDLGLQCLTGAPTRHGSKDVVRIQNDGEK